MKPHRIYAIVLRYMYLFRRSYDRMSDVFYWPTVDIILWGLTSAYFESLTDDTTKILSALLGGLILWFIVWRTQYEISVNLLEDLWNKNLVNIFVSPLKFSEWIVSFICIGLLKIVISISYAAVLAGILYKLNFLSYGSYLLLAIPILIMNGWTLGFTISAIILRFGTKVQTLAWSVPYIVAPLAAIYYPLATLPAAAQKISMFVPMSYIFENARSVINGGQFDYTALMISFGLNTVYLIASIVFLHSSFKKVLQKGLVKLY